LVLVEGSIFTIKGRGIVATFNNPLGIGRDKGAAMIAQGDGIFYNLLRFEIFQADNGQAGVGLVVDKEVFAVIVAVGFAEGGMMGVTPGD
jgi:hypothetical protein